MDLSIVIPCLNEEDTIGTCISKCKHKIDKMGITGEILIADNGSTDNSTKIAKSLGAKIINIKKKGYGKAIIGGIKEASGKFIIMGDADDSYDFNIIDKFYDKLEMGYDIVQGCRFPSGGGKIEKSAMPLSHKYFGNPLFSIISKIFFSLPFNDVYCGFRGFRRDIFLKLNHFSSGMVFAIENLIKFKVYGAKCGEIPITLHKDGRKKSKSHLNTISDGWKTLRFLIVACPKWIYFFPSLILFIFSIYNIFQFFFTDYQNLNIVYSNLFKSVLMFFLSFQIFMFGLFSSLFAVKLKLLKSEFINNFFKIFKLRYAFYISFFLIIFITIINLINLNIFYGTMIKDIIVYSSLMFSILLILNSLYVSLITLDENSS